MEPDYKERCVRCTFHDGHEERVVCVDRVLLAAGRIPNFDTLEVPGHSPSSKIEVDDHLRLTSCANIYVCGDALGKWGLVSVAEMESRHCVEYMFGSKNPITRLEYDDISSVMFVRPEISCVGMNELECRKRHIAYKVGLLRLG